MANGEWYEGEWDGDTMHGQGIFTFKDGSFFEGEFSRVRGRGHAATFMSASTAHRRTCGSLHSQSCYPCTRSRNIERSVALDDLSPTRTSSRPHGAV